MYKRDLDQKLSKSIPQYLMLFGDSEYLNSYYLQYYVNKLNAKEDLLSLYFEDWDFNIAKSYLSQTSLFGGNNLLIVKSIKKIPKKELDVLVNLSKKSSENYFLFIFEGLAKDARGMQKSFGTNWARLFELNIRESIELLQTKADKIGLDIDYYALQHLMVVLNNNLALCDNELNKLTISGTRITSKDIDKLVYSTAPLSTEDFFIELFQKRDITKMLNKLLELGEDEFSLLASTQRFLNEMFLFTAYMKLNNNRVDSMDILGYKLPKPIENQKANIAKRINSSALLSISQHLIDSELKLKHSSTINKESILYGIFIKIQELL
ncbi:FIG00469794: hypothetical protein [hydrothermal vent metagenome]|uniref:DNA polymerase III delta N-terminal domain-containing protein n=1 Tax=hydrothermal vent metagenome TaxID=652676 RepID=A0A1W1C3D3_9ZZZZ